MILTIVHQASFRWVYGQQPQAWSFTACYGCPSVGKRQDTAGSSVFLNAILLSSGERPLLF